jgi:hypothetical protein
MSFGCCERPRHGVGTHSRKTRNALNESTDAELSNTLGERPEESRPEVELQPGRERLLGVLRRGSGVSGVHVLGAKPDAHHVGWNSAQNGEFDE